MKTIGQAIFFRIWLLLITIICTFPTYAQMPPSYLYDNLLVYKSNAVLDRNNNFIEFSGVDYFYLDMDSDGDLWALFFDYDRSGWIKNPCELKGYEGNSLKYSTSNSLTEDILFLISTNCSDLIVAKENSDLTVCYVINNGSNSPSYTTPSYGSPSYSGSYGGNNSYGSSSSSSGRTCISCSGSGKCKTCGGKGYYYHETGYYTGRSGKTRTDCPVCRGTGNCGTCHGAGIIR